MNEEYSNAYKMEGMLFKKKPQYTSMPNRSIVTNVPDEAVCDNRICTSKYTVINFVPLNLFVQFSKIANLYFLIIGIMQMIPSISISGGFPVIFIPLTIVVGVSAFKDFYEDIKRKKSDSQINSKRTLKLSEGGFEETEWQCIRIGDVVKIKKDCFFPADMILLQSSEPQLNCFIETMNLDGETNLKQKQVKFEIGSMLKHIDPVEASGQRESDRQDRKEYSLLFKARERFKYERPNPFIHTFTGSWNGVPLDTNNVVLRGCSLKITEWVTGVVIYTGVDTKIMLNSNPSRQKKSRLEFKMGILVAVVFLVQMLMTLLSGVLSLLSSEKVDAEMFSRWEYLGLFHRLFIKWGSWVLLFTNFVPISLIVSLEMVKYIQGIMISQCEFTSAQPSEVCVQTSSLNEELGMIQHLFSDKTGTLTKNHMNFKYMTVGPQTYGYDSHSLTIPPNITNVDFHDQALLRKLRENQSMENEIHEMLIMLALCHNVVVEKPHQERRSGEGEQFSEFSAQEPIFNASSPDELAFINMAKYCGFLYLGLNDNNEACVQRGEEILKYKVLHTIEFNSDRKRMTVIMEKDDIVFVFCKGADNIIQGRIRNKQSKTYRTMKERIEEWSVDGLRTLLFAKRQIDKKDYQKWAKMYAFSLSRLEIVEKEETEKLKKQFIARLSVLENDQNRATEDLYEKQMSSLQNLSKMIISADHASEAESKKLFEESPQSLMNRLLNDNSVLTEQQKVFISRHLDSTMDEQSMTASSEELEDMLEKELTLVGSTAIEDKLQDNVKSTIEKIRQAGVKVWMLTGDKRQTAVNIGRSCGLIEEDMAVVFWEGSVENTLHKRKQIPADRECCFVATGNDLLGDISEKALLELVSLCKSVICCRVTPKQKQDMVWLMRKNRCTTLGIGDGANDVNMINTAHVGVGIKGVEGAQAALSSDYAISEFQLLGELLLYHGRESYRKNSQLILFNFYKNLLLVLPQFWFGFQNNFSSATIYDPWVYQLYNVLFTSFPIVVYAIFDEQYSIRYSTDNPQLYRVGLENRLFSIGSIGTWFVEPIIFSFFLAVINFSVLEESLNSKGLMFDMMSSGMCIFAQCVIIANLKVIILSYNESPGLYFFSLLGVAFFYLSVFLAEKWFVFGDSINVLENSVTTLGYWACIVANVALIVIYEKIAKVINDMKRMQEVALENRQQQRGTEMQNLVHYPDSADLEKSLI